MIHKDREFPKSKINNNIRRISQRGLQFNLLKLKTPKVPPRQREQLYLPKIEGNSINLTNVKMYP